MAYCTPNCAVAYCSRSDTLAAKSLQVYLTPSQHAHTYTHLNIFQPFSPTSALPAFALQQQQQGGSLIRQPSSSLHLQPKAKSCTHRRCIRRRAYWALESSSQCRRKAQQVHTLMYAAVQLPAAGLKSAAVQPQAASGQLWSTLTIVLLAAAAG